MSPPATRPAWWRDAVFYQVYPRSFADSNGDGLGDITGIRRRLPYLRDLGVDAIWINPWYPSPMADAGYDVADYRDIDPIFGTLPEAEALITDAHGHGLRVLLDIVPNHTSSAHPWFQAALAAAPGSRERRRYLFRPGRGAGSRPPNDWESVFGGPAWTRVVEPDGSPGEWYLHLFDPAQPDLNWDDPEVHAEFESILRFWFDRGVDGFRIDVANALHKQPELPDLAGRSGHPVDDGVDNHPFWDRDTVHEVYREWRVVADSYADPRMFVAEAWVPTPDRLARFTAIADVVVGAILIPGARSPLLITEEMVRAMRAGSVIVDVSIDQGGCVETSRPTTLEDPVFVVHDVVHYCVTNMPGAVGRTSTYALTNATLPYAIALADRGAEGAIRRDPGLRPGVNVAAGQVTHPAVAEAVGLECVPVEKALSATPAPTR